MIKQFMIYLTVLTLLFGKSDPLDVEVYTLENGLTVLLNEDHNETSVFGAVLVKGGGKRDPQDATGIAHYLEHMLFKGTSDIGTIDHDTEKIYLDSIDVLYDQLANTTAEQERLNIQKAINRISIKAADYAIPNEFDKLIEGIGGTGLNAGTNSDGIFYFNQFPGNQIDKWLEIYSHRFMDPVFRLFQSELETVYEEKNRAMDNPFRKFIETFNYHFFKKHPYGQQTVIGSVEHLKNPSLTKMMEYYERYYIANNMYLILSGDIYPDEIRATIAKKFGRLKRGDEIKPIDIKEGPFGGREMVSLRMTPIRFGIIGFRTVPPNHTDREVLDVIRNLFNNSSSTGFLDRLSVENKILSAGAFSIGGIDHGGMGFQFLPKLLFQTFRSAEDLVIDEITKVRNGEFDEDMLESIKLNMIQAHESSLESMQKRLWLILSTIMDNRSWADTRSYPDRIGSIDKAQVLKVAQKYFTDDYLVVRSKIGFPKKTKLEKPPIDPVIPKNTEARSVYAQDLEKIRTKEVVPRFVEFGEDVVMDDIGKNLHFYYTKNPINSIFTMNIQFGVGTIENPALAQAAQYLNLIGTKNRSFNEYKEELQSIGTKVNVYSNSNYFGLNITGFDRYLDRSLEMTNEFITTMHADEKDKKKTKKLVQSSKLNRKTQKKDPTTLGRALRDYAYWDQRSTYLRRSTVAEVKKMDPGYLIKQAKDAMRYETDIFYTGNLEKNEVVRSVEQNLSFDKDPIDSNSPVHLDYKTYTKNTVYLLHDKKAVQSQIYLLAQGSVLDMDQRITSNAFGKYFGRGMASLVFQEIREFRSLAYSSSGYYINRPHLDKRGYFQGFMGTQADKSIEAINTFLDLFNDMPEKENRIHGLRSGLVQSINSSKPGFRARGQAVSNWVKQGYSEDPNRSYYEKYKVLSFDDILSFYSLSIKKEPIVITIVTDKRKIDIEELSRFGKVIDVTKKDIFN